MFDKLKNAVGDSAVKGAVEKFTQVLDQKLAEIASLAPADIKDDARYKTYVVAPALIAVNASSGGATHLIPDFENRFAKAMLHVRNELVVINETNKTIALVPDYRDRLLCSFAGWISSAGLVSA